MSINDYEGKFEQLSRYAQQLMDTEANKIRRFELGLRLEIGRIMVSHYSTNYSEILQWAHSIF